MSDVEVRLSFSEVAALNNAVLREIERTREDARRFHPFVSPDDYLQHLSLVSLAVDRAMRTALGLPKESAPDGHQSS